MSRRVLPAVAALLGAAFLVLAAHAPQRGVPPDDQRMAARLEAAAAEAAAAGHLDAALARALADDDLAAAAELLRLAGHMDLPVDESLRARYRRAADSPWRHLRRAGDFGRGFVGGATDGDAALWGALLADLTVVGDLRDGGGEVLRWLRDEPVDGVVLGLSAAGVGLTAATVASGGAAAPVKAGAALLKASARQGGRLARHLLAAAARGADLRPALRRLHALADTVSPAGALRVVRHVDTVADLARAERVAARFGAATPGLFRLLGKGVYRAFQPVARLSLRAARLLWCAGLSLATCLLGLAAAAASAGGAARCVKGRNRDVRHHVPAR